MAGDLAADVVRLLSDGARLTWPAVPGGEAVTRPVQPGDIAVLCRANKNAEDVRAALAARDVPAVLTAARSVFATPAATDWLVLLEALEQPGNLRRGRRAALSPFLGWTAHRLAADRDEDLDELAVRLRGWGRLLAARGMAALLEAVTTGSDLTARLLRHDGGERRVTDLRHVGELLHAASTRTGTGPAALVQWLRAEVDEADRDARDERGRRMESDAAAVQVLTVHRSKGLEFPVVYLPAAADRNVADDKGQALRLHDRPDPDGRSERLLDIGGTGTPDRAARFRAYQEEESGEDLRLLYVAATRAACSVVLWWASTANTPSSALSRLLLGGHTEGEVPPAGVSTPPEDALVARLDALAAASDGTLAVERVQPGDPPGLDRYRPPSAPAEQLAAAPFDRSFDLRWRRTSYSALTAAAHAAAHPVVPTGSEPEQPGHDDEPGAVEEPLDAATGRPASAGDPLTDLVLPMGSLPGGAGFGTLVHEVLEHADPDAPDLVAELRARAVTARKRSAVTVEPADLAAALLPVLETPLGPLAGDARLRDVPRRDRLTELGFELPLAGATGGPGELRLGDLAAVLAEHLPADDPLAAYPALLAGPDLAGQPARGYLSGSLDLVLRVGDRYLVADYKTNRLAPTEETLTAWHYRPAALVPAMTAAHYPLQGLLYAVALHRFLRWRLPGYDPDRHLGGVLFLFVRGMVGKATPRVDGMPCGVFSWRPSGPLVEAASRVLAGDRS